MVCTNDSLWFRWQPRLQAKQEPLAGFGHPPDGQSQGQRLRSTAGCLWNGHIVPTPNPPSPTGEEGAKALTYYYALVITNNKQQTTTNKAHAKQQTNKANKNTNNNTKHIQKQHQKQHQHQHQHQHQLNLSLGRWMIRSDFLIQLWFIQPREAPSLCWLNLRSHIERGSNLPLSQPTSACSCQVSGTQSAKAAAFGGGWWVVNQHNERSKKATCLSKGWLTIVDQNVTSM